MRAWLSGGFNSNARSAGEKAALYQGQFDIGRRFADDRFGIFLSANYGVSNGNSQETENDGEWEWQSRNPPRQAKVAITEISYKKNSIRLKTTQKLLIGITP